MRSELACYQLVCHFKCYWTRAPARTHTRARCTPHRTTNFLCLGSIAYSPAQMYGGIEWTENQSVKTHDGLPPTAATATACARCSIARRLGVVCVSLLHRQHEQIGPTTTATTTHLTSETKTIRNDSNVRRTPEAIKAIRLPVRCACDPLDAAWLSARHTRR